MDSLKCALPTYKPVCKNRIQSMEYICIIYIRRKPCNSLTINTCFSIFCKKNTSN